MGWKFNPFTLSLDNTGSGGGGTPGGANTNVQFNNSGSFGGDSNFIWDNTNKALGVAITGSPLGKVHAKGTTPPDRPASVTVALGSYGLGFAYDTAGTVDYRVYSRENGIFSNNYRNNTLAIPDANWQPSSTYAAMSNIALGNYDESSYPSIYKLYAVYTGFVGQPTSVGFAPDLAPTGLNGAYNGPQGSPGYEATGQTIDFRVVTVYGTQYTSQPATFQYIDSLADNSYFYLDFSWTNPSGSTPDAVYIQRDTGSGFVDYIDVTAFTSFTDANTDWINGDPLSGFSSPINFDVEIFFNPPTLATDFVEFLIVDETRVEYITALDTDLSLVDNGTGWTAGTPTLDPFVTYEIDVSWATVTGVDDYRVVAANTGDGKNYNYYRDVTAPTVSFTDDDTGWTGPGTVTLTPNSGFAFYAEESDSYYGGRAIFERNTTAPTNTDVDMFFILNNTNASGVSKIGFSTNSSMKTVVSSNQFGYLLFKTQHNASSYIGFNAGNTGLSDSTPVLAVQSSGVGIFNATPTSALSASLQIFNNSASKIGLIVRGTTSQSGDLITVQNVGGATLFNVTSDGKITVNSNQAATGSSIFKGSATQNLLNIGHNSNAIAIGTNPESGVQLKIESLNAANNMLVLKGAASQTGNLFDAKDDAENILFSLLQDGRIQAPDGSASSPTYSFLNGINSGLFFSSGTTAIGFATSGTERMRVVGQGLGLFRTNVSAKLHIAGGSTSSSSAPIKIESGPLMTVPESGAIERLTDKLHFTLSTGTARKEITLNDAALTSGRVPFVTTNGRLTDDADMTFATDTLTVTKHKIGSSGTAMDGVFSATATLDFPSIAPNDTHVLTMTVTGAATGDVVVLGAPSTIESDLLWDGFVSSANTVSVRLHNSSGGSIDPASATWRATVISF